MKKTIAIANRQKELRYSSVNLHRCLDVLPGEQFEIEGAISYANMVKRDVQGVITALKAQKRKDAKASAKVNA